MNHPANFIDLTGQKFNHLVVLGISRLESMRSNAMDERERRMVDRWMDEAENQ